MAANETEQQPPHPPQWAAESNTETLLAVMITFTCLALLIVTLRLYTRIKIVKSAGWDDWLMSLAMAFTLGGQACYIVMGVHGMGKHIQTVSTEDMMVYREASWFKSMVHAAGSLCFLKLSIGAHLLRLVSHTRLKWAIWATMIYVVLYTIVGCMSLLFLCTPVQYNWDKSIPRGQCYGKELLIRFALFNTSNNIFTDVLFASFPIPIIWKMNAKKRIRAYLIGVLSLGYFAVVFGVLKAAAQLRVFHGDPFYYNWLDLFGHLQITVGIIAACAPILKALVSHALNLGSDGQGSAGSPPPNGFLGMTTGSKKRLIIGHPKLITASSFEERSHCSTPENRSDRDTFPPRLDLERGQVTSRAEYFNRSVHYSSYGGGFDDGSESGGDLEARWHDDRLKQHDGILCTTEVIIHR